MDIDSNIFAKPINALYDISEHQSLEVESRSADRALMFKKKDLSKLEYLQRKLNGIRRHMKLTGDFLNDRKRYNNASLSMKVKTKRTMSRIEVLKKEIGQ